MVVEQAPFEKDGDKTLTDSEDKQRNAEQAAVPPQLSF